MKKIGVVLAVLLSTCALADVNISRQALGSGSPGYVGNEDTTEVYDGIYHAPQYLPGFPTAATIWPRVVEVNCMQDGDKLNCDGYNWLPEMGRGEYLFIKPRMVTPPKVTERVIFKEVPIKKKRE